MTNEEAQTELCSLTKTTDEVYRIALNLYSRSIQLKSYLWWIVTGASGGTAKKRNRLAESVEDIEGQVRGEPGDRSEGTQGVEWICGVSIAIGRILQRIIFGNAPPGAQRATNCKKTKRYERTCRGK